MSGTPSRPPQRIYQLDPSGSQGESYSYDSSGNWTATLSSQGDTLSAMRYNRLHLPAEFTTAAGVTVNYVYSADGEKLYVEENPSGGTVQGTEYAANYRIENGTVTMIHTDAGYYTPYPASSGGTGASYRHIWYLKDHLGNNRVLANDHGYAMAVRHYDPYGAEIDIATSTPFYPFISGMTESPYKYGGKEWSATTSTYDFEARQFSPSFHRFTTMDPLAEKYYSISPYAYCAGNPVNMKDEEGLSPNYVIPIPFPVIEKIGELVVLAVGASVLAQYISYRARIEMANSKNTEGWANQKKEDRKAQDDFNKRQVKMQESINEHFPDQNDPNREPNWNGKHKGLRTFLIILELVHQVKDFIHPKDEDQDRSKENIPKERSEYIIQPQESINNVENPSRIGTDWIQSLNIHMSNFFQ